MSAPTSSPPAPATRASEGGTRSRHVDPTRRQQAVAAWLLALPFVLLFVVFSLGPVLASLGMSFTDMKRIDIRNPFAVEFVGIDNYTKLVQDPLFRKVTLNTLLYLVLGVPLTMAVALLVAIGINRVERFRGFLRVGYYLPVVTSIVAVSVVWKFLYRDNGGLFNTILGWVGIDGPGWLDSTTLALPSLVLMAVWRNFGTLMVIFLAFSLGPVLLSLGMSFTDMKRTDIRNPFAVDIVGLENYVQLVQDPLFRKVTLNTLLYLLLGVPATMAVALAAAVGINRIERLRGFFRVGYYLPVVTSIVAVSVVWKYLYRDNGGLFNTVLGWVGIDGPGWLDSTTLALPSLVLMAVWRNAGTLMVIFLAALQTIPQEVTEAAEVDGATGWSRFRHVTLPLLRPTLLFGAVITGIGYLQFFEEAVVMTKGGPLDSTRSVTYFVFDQFGFGNYGYAAAASYLLFLAVVLLTWLQFRWLGEREAKR